MAGKRSSHVTRGQAGYTLVELLVSTAIMLVVTGAIFSLVNPAQSNTQAQPELADLQQRMRIGSDVLFRDLLMAGAGPYQGSTTGSLINFFAPILPRRTGLVSPDPSTTFRPEAITLMYVPNTYSQTTIRQRMPDPSAELKVTDQPNCPGGDALCGFKEGMSVIIFDTSGFFDVFTVTQVQDDAGHLQHRGQDFSHAYEVGASVTQVRSMTYYLDRNSNQLRMYDGGTVDVPLLDNVVDLAFDYFGDPDPPKTPKPLAGVANCLYDAEGNYDSDDLVQLPADEGSLAHLTPALLTDGPFCGSGSNQFDADLLRVRKVRVRIRMQAGLASMRGTDRRLFMHPGTATGGDRYIPDYMVSLDISPRNLNLIR
jgi:prepilin-type N-terminal cleavage/methylation domain-containing protein